MVFFRHYFKVFNSVIVRVAILVVYNLVACQVPPNVGLHYESVNHNIPLTIRTGVIWLPKGKVLAVAPVSYWRRSPLGTSLVLDATFKRAEHLVATPCGSSWVATLPADRNSTLSPSGAEITGTGTVFRLGCSSVLWGEVLFAFLANRSQVNVWHSTVYPTEEKYCEIAVQRLAQKVMRFD